MEQHPEQPLADAPSSPPVELEHGQHESRGAKARKTRMQNSTPTQRRTVARKAANARWGAKNAPPGRRGLWRNSAPGATSAVFGKALAAAENRLAVAIQERADHANMAAYHASMVAALDAEIPSLVKAIRALKNTQEPQLAVPSVSAAQQLASTVRLPASPAQGTALGVDLSDTADEDQLLRDSDLAGGAWH